MIIQEVLDGLEGRDQPLAKGLYKGENCKVLVIGFKKGMSLKEHVAHLPSKLVVLSGTVIYKAEKDTLLKTYDEINIPLNVLHSLQAVEDSLCILMQG